MLNNTMDFQFSAELTDFKIVHNVLKAISFKEFAIVQPLKEGLKVTVEEMKCVETSAYIPHNMFTSYCVAPDEELKFKLSLKVLTECLNIYGDDGNPSLKMTYKGAGSPLCLIMKHSEENITVDCEISTLNAEEDLLMSLAYECTEDKVVVNAGQFVDVLADLDSTSDDLELLLSPDLPYFRITTTSIMGESQVDISKDSEMVLLFQWKNKVTSKYTFSPIRQILKVMNYANKVSITIGDSGLLGLQLMINADEKQMFVEYYVMAMFEDND